MTFVNKMDRESREPVELMDEVESVLNIECAPMTWPIGSGRGFRGLYRLFDDSVHLVGGRPGNPPDDRRIQGLDSEELAGVLGPDAERLREEIELVRGASHAFDPERYLAGRQTPVFFGSALNDWGVEELLDIFVAQAPAPRPREAMERVVRPEEQKFSGVVFKIQANMDPAHHDRIAFLRVNSGRFNKGMKLRHVRTGRDIAIHSAITFMASRRGQADDAYAGDIIGLHNHGTIQIGDTFTEGEELKFSGIPNFAPELFRRVQLRDPLRAKALQKGLIQLSEEGATQVFKPLNNNDLILGAVGTLQFDVVAHRLKTEYGVDAAFEAVPVSTARWVTCPDPRTEQEFRSKVADNLATDGAGSLTYIAPNRVNLQLAQERWPNVEFRATREV
jgi:peptide chain release factor 3